MKIKLREGLRGEGNFLFFSAKKDVGSPEGRGSSSCIIFPGTLPPRRPPARIFIRNFVRWKLQSTSAESTSVQHSARGTEIVDLNLDRNIRMKNKEKIRNSSDWSFLEYEAERGKVLCSFAVTRQSARTHFFLGFSHSIHNSNPQIHYKKRFL